VGPPGYSYLATYHGDSNYAPIALPTERCEIVLVGKLDSQISTHIFEVRDAFGNVVPGQCTTASGTCGPSAQSTAAVCSVTGNLCAKDVTDNFIDIGVATPCEAAGGTCDTTVTPAVCSVSGQSCAPGGVTVKVRDQALVSPVSGSASTTPTGTVTFTVYSNADCTGSTQVSTVSVGTSAPLCNTGVPAVTACAQTGELTQGASGLSFRVTYSGDSIYNGSEASRCEPVCAINTAIQ